VGKAWEAEVEWRVKEGAVYVRTAAEAGQQDIEKKFQV